MQHKAGGQIRPDQEGRGGGQSDEMDHPTVTPSISGRSTARKKGDTEEDDLLDTNDLLRSLEDEEDTVVAQEITRLELRDDRGGQGALDRSVLPGQVELHLVEVDKVVLLVTIVQPMGYGNEEDNWMVYYQCHLLSRVPRVCWERLWRRRMS